MCGIAGEIDFSPDRPERGEVYEQMKRALKPRGPDQDDIVHRGAATFIHTRLSVVDLEHGRQPMSREYHGERYTLVYNGELYNTEDLRRDLSLMGHTFEGHSDTEVLLTAFLAWGEDCVHHFNGIFAFAVWAEGTQTLFLARDRMGVKPLFYAHVGDTLVFASELKALLCHPLVPPVVTKSSLAELLLLGPGRTMGSCVYDNVFEVAPGHCGTFSRDGLSLRRYWVLQDKIFPDCLEDALSNVKSLVTDAIERQFVSDVPICTFLSGGLDSSIITAVGARHLKKQGKTLSTFSVDYVGNSEHFLPTHFQPSRDDQYIKLVSEMYHTDHHTVTLDTPELVESLYAATEARDLPGMADVDSSLLLFCKEVRNHASVALSGECADELFGGYPWYRDEDIRTKSGFPWAQNTAYRQSFLSPDLTAAVHGETFVANRYAATLADTNKINNLTPIESRMKEMTRLNTDWFMQTLLERKDRMSMANGLEVRVPFCDYRIAEYLYSMPWSLKDLDGYEKGILRRAVDGLLPKEVLWRKKNPYPKTANPAYLAAVRTIFAEILSDPNAPILSFLNRDALTALLHDERSTPWYGQLMTTPQTIAYFIQMNHWLNTYHVTIV